METFTNYLLLAVNCLLVIAGRLITANFLHLFEFTNCNNIELFRFQNCCSSFTPTPIYLTAPHIIIIKEKQCRFPFTSIPQTVLFIRFKDELPYTVYPVAYMIDALFGTEWSEDPRLQIFKSFTTHFHLLNTPTKKFSRNSNFPPSILLAQRYQSFKYNK